MAAAVLKKLLNREVAEAAGESSVALLAWSRTTGELTFI